MLASKKHRFEQCFKLTAIINSNDGKEVPMKIQLDNEGTIYLLKGGFTSEIERLLDG
jgi:hypothetical protein